MTIRAVIFDLGGVVFPSPFEAMDEYDHGHGLSNGTVRALIRQSSEEGAWAALERGEMSMDDFMFELEAEATEAGFQLDARKLMELVGSGFGPRPEMARAIDVIRAHGLRTAALTNNWAHDNERAAPQTPHDALAFDVVVESAREGLRKPDSRIYTLVLARLDVVGPEAVFLDDLGINLKPARALGMHTIKVGDPDLAIDELQAIVGIPLR